MWKTGLSHPAWSQASVGHCATSNPDNNIFLFLIGEEMLPSPKSQLPGGAPGRRPGRKPSRL